jgi:2-hydroxychromene-2-carboxylate isomerase
MSAAKDVEFFFDVGSPYTYMAATQMNAFEKRTGANVIWRPFLLGGVFKATGNNMPARVPNKAMWMMKDLKHWAAHYGVSFKMSSHFPINSLRPQRALVAAEKAEGQAAVAAFAMSLFQAYWVDDVDVSTDENIGRCATAAGLEGAAMIAGTLDPVIKAELMTNSEEAVKRGAFGAPSFFVGDELFWGNDRLLLLEEYITA